MKIEIYTRSMNVNLYRLSQSTIQLPYPRRRCLFTSADGYFYDNIINSNADIILNIDEDAFITDNRRLEVLLEYVLDNGFVNCGVPDGGVIPIRKHNPLVTNPFFNILNVGEIRKKFDLREIKQNYSSHRKGFERFVPEHLLKSSYEFDYFEPYNSFFVWLATHFKTLYLNAEEHEDEISTIVKDHLDQPFLVHSWYSRFYGEDEYHTNRIDNLVRDALQMKDLNPILNSKNTFAEVYERLGQKYYYPIKYRWERKQGY